jgi:hypothetical protein
MYSDTVLVVNVNVLSAGNVVVNNIQYMYTENVLVNNEYI